jgi:hypothetical protein
VQTFGNNIADRRFSGTHRSDQDDISMTHAPMIPQTKKRQPPGLPLF